MMHDKDPLPSALQVVGFTSNEETHNTVTTPSKTTGNNPLYSHQEQLKRLSPKPMPSLFTYQDEEDI